VSLSREEPHFTRCATTFLSQSATYWRRCWKIHSAAAPGRNGALHLCNIPILGSGAEPSCLEMVGCPQKKFLGITSDVESVASRALKHDERAIHGRR
jgi:hypothetical protein